MLSFHHASQIVFHHLFRLLTDERLATEHLVVVTLLDEFHHLPIEGIELNTIDVGPTVVKPNLLNNDYSVAEADAQIVAVPVATLVLVADEHLLTVIPNRDMNTRVAE